MLKQLLPTIAAITALLSAPAAVAAPNDAARLVDAKSPVARGEQAHLVANAPTGQLCTITVYSKKGRVYAHALHPATAQPGEDGRLAWTLKVGIRATLGWRYIRINCGSAGSIRTSFLVIR